MARESEGSPGRGSRANRRHRIVTDDIFTLRLVTESQITGDGSAVAFVVADGFRDGTKRAKSSIWVADLDQDGRQKGKSRRFTVGTKTDCYPRWSPRGDKLAFLSDRSDGEKLQVFVMNRTGGEAVQLTDVKGEIGASTFTALPQVISWSPDGRRIAFLMWDAKTEAEEEEASRSGDVLEFEKVPKFCQIWTVDVRTRELARATDGSYQVWEFDWSRDGRTFAAIVSEAPYEWSWYRAKLAVIPVSTGRARVVYDPRPRQIARPLFSLDGSSLYFISSVLSDRNVVAGDLFSIELKARARAKDLTKGYRGSISWMEWLSPAELVLAGIEGLKTVFSRLDVSRKDDPNARQTIWSGDVTLATSYWRRFSLSQRTGRVAVGREDLRTPPEAWVGEIADDRMEWTQLSDFNAHVRHWDSGEIGPVEWPSEYKGRTQRMQGFLMMPTERSRRGKAPLVVIAHGGPTQCNGHRYYFLNAYGTHLLAARGFGVFIPNPRGSYGRGLRFAEANVGDMGGGDFADIMAGVDHCLASGNFDPKRVYLMGGSYGGFMTAWAVTQTHRFRGAIMQWGISDWLSFHGTTDIPLWDSGQYRSDPYNPNGRQAMFSPINHVRKVRTPTLIVQGGNDTACPPSQSYEFFRALKELGVETELVVYPGEGHGLSQRAHVKDALERYLGWFEDHGGAVVRPRSRSRRRVERG